MARFCGNIGFATLTNSYGVYTETITERQYYGDVNRIVNRVQGSENLNDDLVLNNEFSIVADAFANENFQAIRYVEYMGMKWKVTAVQVQAPRLIINAGGAYNGQSPSIT